MKKTQPSITTTSHINSFDSSWRMKAVCTCLLFAAGCASSHPQSAPLGAANLPAQNGKSDAEREQPQSGASSKAETGDNNPGQTNNGNSQSAPSAKERAAQQTAEPQPARGELALLKIEVMSLKEKMAALQRKMDVIFNLIKIDRGGEATPVFST
ncbi:hypothetical protein EBR21_12790, partial [bacterium]|nr:hypothetical protein [bacterium]